jgi:capsular exopolysaccharide synthesis family protein
LSDEERDVRSDPSDYPLSIARKGEREWAESAGDQDVSENPVKVVNRLLHGRWKFAIICGMVLSPIGAWIGYAKAPVKYRSTSVLVVESELTTLVEETIETAGIEQYSAFVSEQAQLLRDPQVLFTAFDDPDLVSFRDSRPDFKESIFENLRVENPTRSSLVIVSLEDQDPTFAAYAVNAVVRAYEKVFAPNTEREYQEKFEKIEVMVEESRSRIGRLKLSQNEAARNSRYGRSDVSSAIDENVTSIRTLEIQEDLVDDALDVIREQVGREAQVKAESEGRKPTPAEIEPTVEAMLTPSLTDLVEVDQSIPSLKEQLNQSRIEFEVTSRRFGPQHVKYRRDKMNYESKQANFEGRVEAASMTWREGPGSKANWGSLLERKKTIEKQITGLVSENEGLELIRITVDEFSGRIEQEGRELAKLEERIKNLVREKDSIRAGRVDVRAVAVPAYAPTSDKKIPALFAGFVGVWVLSFGFFLVLGFFDHKTFGVAQLKDQRNSLKVLGVLPNMDEVETNANAVVLASDCVHRLRGRIEARRSPEKGYSIMVSSPFQGDGKTTLAVSLGWSYAESGYKTLLIDADFVGRAMTHQFGRLREPGFREVIRNGGINGEIIELGHPNLNLLGVGFDRRVSAANLSPKLFSRVIDAVRSDFDIVIVDSGPITASIEAISIASAVDGVILALRRGRSRSRLTECIQDIRSVGADYLGVVLNYADRSDCERYGSTSKMSAGVEEALLDESQEALPAQSNPLLGDMQNRRPI